MKMKLLLLTAPVALAGCANFKTEAVEPRATAVNKSVAGLPFTLNKPQFNITRTPGGGDAPDKYTLTPSYVPDPRQTFAASIHPSVLSSVDWTLSWDEGGSLTESNGKFTDQTVATLTSLAKLGLSVAALDELKQTQGESVTAIDARLARNFASGQPLVFDEFVGRLRPARPAELASLRSAWQGAQPRFQRLANQNRLKTYTYQDATERALLVTALRPFALETAYATPALLAKADAETDDIDPQAELRRPFAYQILDAYAEFDLARLKAIKAAALKTRVRAEAELRLLNADRAKFDSSEDIKLQDRIVLLANDAIQKLSTPPNDVLLAIVGIPVTEWEARRVAELNTAIGQRLATVRAAAGASGAGDLERTDPVLRDLHRRKAAVLGMLDTYEQAERLRDVPATDPARFKDARESLEPLLKRLAEAEAGLAVAAATPKVEEAVVAEYLQAGVGDAPDDDWISKRTLGRPLYVVVLKPAPGAPPSVLDPSVIAAQPPPAPARASTNPSTAKEGQ